MFWNEFQQRLINCEWNKIWSDLYTINTIHIIFDLQHKYSLFSSIFSIRFSLVPSERYGNDTLIVLLVIQILLKFWSGYFRIWTIFEREIYQSVLESVHFSTLSTATISFLNGFTPFLAHCFFKKILHFYRYIYLEIDYLACPVSISDMI